MFYQERASQPKFYLQLLKSYPKEFAPSDGENDFDEYEAIRKARGERVVPESSLIDNHVVITVRHLILE